MIEREERFCPLLTRISGMSPFSLPLDPRPLFGPLKPASGLLKNIAEWAEGEGGGKGRNWLLARSTRHSSPLLPFPLRPCYILLQDVFARGGWSRNIFWVLLYFLFRQQFMRIAPSDSCWGVSFCPRHTCLTKLVTCHQKRETLSLFFLRNTPFPSFSTKSCLTSFVCERKN